jgi:hypothetical protein
MMLGVMAWRRHRLIGFPRRTLILLRGTHRSHRQLERSAVLGTGRKGKLWGGYRKDANCRQLHSVARHDVHDVIPACKDGGVSGQANALPTQLKDSARVNLK